MLCAYKFYNNVANQLDLDHKPTKDIILGVHQRLDELNSTMMRSQLHLDKLILLQFGNSSAVTFLRCLLNEQHDRRALLIKRLEINLQEIRHYAKSYRQQLKQQIETWKNYSPSLKYKNRREYLCQFEVKNVIGNKFS